VLLEVSVARTRNWCGPGSKSVYVTGDVQEPNDGESSAHWKVEPASFEEKENVAL
jgi:hypothetical protein